MIHYNTENTVGYSKDNLKIHTGVPSLPSLPYLTSHFPPAFPPSPPSLPSYIPLPLEVGPLKSS